MGALGLEAQPLQVAGQRFNDRALVVDHEDAGRGELRVAEGGLVHRRDPLRIKAQTPGGGAEAIACPANAAVQSSISDCHDLHPFILGTGRSI